jgi:hypothetical protein
MGQAEAGNILFEGASNSCKSFILMGQEATESHSFTGEREQLLVDLIQSPGITRYSLSHS